MTLFFWGVLAATAGIALAIWSYYRLPVRVPKAWLYVLGALRAAAVWAILFLLGEPILTQYLQQEERPLVILLADNSKSAFWKSAVSPQAFSQELGELRRSMEAKGFNTALYAFDSEIRPADSLTGQGRASQISSSLRQALEAHPHAAAVVLFSDGQENSEVAPLPTEVPVWTVGIGSEVPTADAALEGIDLPPWVSEKQPILLQVHISGLTVDGTLIVRSAGGEQRFTVPAQTQRYSVSLPPLPIGYHALRLFLEVPNDPNPSNNQRATLVEVRPERITFFLWAGEITPDVAFLRARLEQLGTVRLILARKPSGYTLMPDTLRPNPQDVHILYNFPARVEDEPWAEKLLRENAFILLSWGAIQPKENLLQAVGIQRWGGLVPQTLSGGATVYFHTSDPHPAAQPITLAGERPIGYKFYQGNRMVCLLLGEGWWRLREVAPLQQKWDSILFAVLQEGLRLQRSRWLFTPKRNPIALGEVVIWSGFLPPTAKLTIGKITVPLHFRPDGFTEALWMPDSAGVYTYTVYDGQSPLLSGALLVENLEAEMQRLGVDTTYLRFVARATGGQYLSWSERKGLVDSLRARLPVSAFLTSQRLVVPFHEWSLWLVLILSLLSAEWLLRRYVGLY